jgi:Na+-transporting methylmalonyl-CoA/oxaloacetate decarboxylase gamma subunit
MKKKIALMLSILSILSVLLCGCGTDPADVDYNGYTYDELLNNVYTDIQIVQNLSESLSEYGITVDDLYTHTYSADYEYLISAGITDEMLEATASWDEVAAEFGTYTSMDADSFSVDKAGKTLTTDMTLIFTADDGSTRDITFEVVYNYNTMEVTGISINPVYSMGQKLSKAGLNTLISISVVFVVLILISLIIYAFNIFPYLEKKKQEKAKADKAGEASADHVVSQIEQREVQQDAMDDTELVAVIAAAVAASEGTSTSDFVVRSIIRR